MTDIIKQAFDAGAYQALADFGLTKTAGPQGLGMFPSQQNLHAAARGQGQPTSDMRSMAAGTWGAPQVNQIQARNTLQSQEQLASNGALHRMQAAHPGGEGGRGTDQFGSYSQMAQYMNKNYGTNTSGAALSKNFGNAMIHPGTRFDTAGMLAAMNGDAPAKNWQQFAGGLGKAQAAPMAGRARPAPAARPAPGPEASQDIPSMQSSIRGTSTFQNAPARSNQMAVTNTDMARAGYAAPATAPAQQAAAPAPAPKGKKG